MAAGGLAQHTQLVQRALHWLPTGRRSGPGAACFFALLQRYNSSARLLLLRGRARRRRQLQILYLEYKIRLYVFM